MAAIKTINFLPEVFQTDTNQKFLNATLDQLVTPPDLRKVNAYVGRKFAPTFKNTDNYQPEPTALRQNYQLEPSVVVKNPQSGVVEFFSSYIDAINQLGYNGALTNNQSRLFSNETYSFDGLFDFDKFVNFSQYYWLPTGPATVDVFGAGVDQQATYVVTRDTTTGTYSFSGAGTQENPTLRLARGGTYKFIVNQPGYPFWIQSAPGLSGLINNQSNLSSRDVFGVNNNGTDVGTITFTVPQTTSQDYYRFMPLVATVDSTTNLHYTQIQGATVSELVALGGLDGITSQLIGKTFIFTNKDIDDIFWTVDSNTVSTAQRRNVWKVTAVDLTVPDPVINLTPQVDVSVNNRVYVTGGQTYAEFTFYLNGDFNYYFAVPNITADLTTLYYQDGASNTYVGEFNLVTIDDNTINVDTDIVGQKSYTSPNGVIFTNGLQIRFDSSASPSIYAGNTYFVEGVGTAIRLLAVTTFQTPEAYASQGLVQDYITINRASQDLNPWTRSNRWFHSDVIKASATYNNTVPVFDQNARANRPIIEFEADLQLYNFGRVAKVPVDIFSNDGTITDARNQVELQNYKEINGVILQNGMRVIFANDFDPTVRNQIFIVNISEINNTPVITLSPAEDYLISPYNNLIVLQGTNAGTEYWYDGNVWNEGQQKTAINQTPMFDVIDSTGISLGDTNVYPDSTFATTKNNLGTVVGGTPIFTYAVGTGTVDQVLGFPLSYRTFNQVGDIQFVNNFDNDSFSYTTGSGETDTQNVNTFGTLQQNNGLTNYNLRNAWTTVVENSKQYQIISYVYSGTTTQFQIDILPDASASIPYIKVFRNFNQLSATEFQILQTGVNYYVQITDTNLTINDQIDILIYSSSDVSSIGHYQVPDNLNYNSQNTNFTSLTLGQLRNHLVALVSNSNRVLGNALGENNLRDIPVKGQGGNILQNASPVLYGEIFTVDSDVNFLKSLEYARHNYSRFKNKILESAANLKTVDTTNIAGVLDSILLTINSVKNNTFPWYYSDMVPYGPLKNTITYTVIDVEQTDYEISAVFSDTTLSNQAVLVYVNGTQLVKGIDYTFDTTRAGITITSSLDYGDTITINEYSNTDANYIPETPTKLGLYPKFTPSVYVDNTYITPTTMIQGHDGSLTPAFGDFRDQLLLEFELRIYNNIKVDYQSNVDDIYNFQPGAFRNTGYSNAEFTQLLTESFLEWVGNNRVDFTTNSYFVASDPFTWNYSRFADTVTGELLPGTWRAIFKKFYDTDRPNTNPWEMVGFSEMPQWWQNRYGPAPYTGGNMVLWNDMAAGIVWNNGDSYVDERFIRPGLLDIIPVDSNGNVRAPTEFIVKGYNSSQANTSYAVGNQGPVETAWRRSSDFAFAMQEALALANPAYYFGTLMDVSRYYKNSSLNQYVLSDTLQRITPAAVNINGETNGIANLRVAGYLNWISDYLRSQGIDPVAKIKGYLSAVNVQLAYKMAGYSDNSFIEVLAEQASPASTTNSVVIPNENYSIQLYKSTPTQNITYSAVVIEVSQNGYTVSGYDTSNPYFTIIPSLANNNSYPISVLNDVGIIYNDYHAYKVTVPYGYEFTNKQQVVDFLISYERFLTGNGIVFADYDTDLGLQRDFKLSVQEFLSWSQQGWQPGSVIVLSPILGHLVVTTANGVIDQIQNSPQSTRVLDTGYNFIKYNNFSVTRTDNTFTLTTTLGQTIALAVLDVVEYEHVLIFDNTTVFNDVIYVPSLGNRQYRLKLIGQKTGSWTGALNPAGFIYNSPTVDTWQPGVDYALGSLINFKNTYYTATQDLAATATFNPAQWQQLNSNQIQTGLLPNFSYNAGKSQRYNDLTNPELQGDFSRFVGSEIGFRERDYLTNFGIDLPTQAKFYQGFIRQKGSLNAVTALTAVGFNSITSNISLYEEWAIRVGEYGALNNNQYLELQLTEGQYNGDPVTFTLLPNSTSTTNNIIGVYPGNLYLTSVGLSNFDPAIFTNRDDTSFYENDISTAGYVSVGDVDLQIFDMANYSQLDANLSQVSVGTKIWAAKDNVTTGWNVYRVTETDLSVTTVAYSVDIIATVTVSTPHSFVYGDFVVIKGFDYRVDGFYQVYSTVDAFNFNVVVPGSNLDTIKSAGTVTGTGPIFKLTSMRLKNSTDITEITPPNGWVDGDKLWSDYDQNVGGWAVYNKSSPWTQANYSVVPNANVSMELNSNSYVTGSGFGSVTAISPSGSFSAAGMPTLNNGNVIVFVANVTNGNVFTEVANLGATHSNVNSLFGASLATSANLLYIGAPGTGSQHGFVHIHQFDGNASFNWAQTLSSPFTGNAGDQFGYSVSSSTDGTWLYVGAPAAGNVYVYHANANSYYSYANTITGNSYVTGGNASYTQFGYNVSTTTFGSQVVIGSPYESVANVTASGAVYVFNRSRESFVASGNVAYFPQFPINTNTVKVTVNGNAITSGFTTNSSAVTFTNAPVVGTTITIDTNKIELLEKLTAPTPISGASFGIVSTVTGNDADIFVASPGYSAPGYYSGIVYRFVNEGANYGTITNTVANAAITSGNNFYINGYLVTVTGNTVSNVATSINSANIAGVRATASAAGYLTITSNVIVPFNKLSISPGTGTILTDLGLNVFANTQAIMHPGTSDVNAFGSQIVTTPDSNSVIIGADRGASYIETTFDVSTTNSISTSTLFDSTEFFDGIPGSGVVYIYGLVENPLSVTTPDQYVLVQQLENNSLSTNDEFGASLALAANILLVGAPGDSNHTGFDPLSDLIVAIPNSGTYYTYNNFTGNVGWDVISSKQPQVDINSISRMYIYDNTTSTLLTNFDYIDPAKGKVLGVAQQDLDFITAYDPAVYNAVAGLDSIPDLSYNTDYHWGANQVTKTWWDLSQVRYYNYEQGNITYRANNWGQAFPGSKIQVAEWVQSNVLPSQYAGSGQALYPDDSAFVIESYVDSATKILRSRYYYWVINKTTLENESVHKNSISTIQDIIANPTAQSIPFAAVLKDDTISLYNVSDYLIGSGNTTIFHADYDVLKNTNVLHSEFALIQENNSQSTIPTRIVSKMVDSLAGIDANGNPVPDPSLSFQTRLGLGINPNQTIFVNSSAALQNFITYVNKILIDFAIVEEFDLTAINAADPVPSEETYDLAVANHADLTYVDTSMLSAGYTILVEADETENGLWVVYVWSGTIWVATSTQKYYTPAYWSYANWYSTTYDPTIKVTNLVNTYSDLATLTPNLNDTAQVANRGNGQFAIYQWDGNNWNLVGLENGTIQFDSSLYTTATSGFEIRIIVNAIQTMFESTKFNILVGTSSFNSLFFFMVNYILSEQKSVDWIFKTSFVSIFHQLRQLEQFPAFIQDNQTYYEDYINEVKPYRTSIREYKIDYTGNDEYYGDTTDFDIPATYISNVSGYRSPNGSIVSDVYNLSNLPQYTEWYNNHSYSIQSIGVVNAGANYFATPTVTVVGGGGTGANIQALVDFSSNSIMGFEVVDGGSGYTSTPTIQINGTGTGATAYPNLVNQQFIKTVNLQEIALVNNVTVYAGNIITQPNSDASGVVYTTSSGNIITLTDVLGTFTSNQYIFSGNAYYNTSNLQVRVGVPTTTMSLTGPDFGIVTVTQGDIITQPNTGAQAEVYATTTGNVISLWNVTGVFSGNAYLFDNGSNLAVSPSYYTISSTATPVSSYITFVDQSYNKVRTFDQTIKFDRTTYSSNIIAWQPNITVSGNTWVSYNGRGYQANATVYSSATLKLSGNIIANVGNYITQVGNPTANATVISANLDVITVSNVSGAYNRRGGNIIVNGITSTVNPVAITNIFDYSQYALIPSSNFTNASDRIIAEYQPDSSMPGRDLSQLMTGIDYPGVQVQGVKFNATTSNISSNVLYFYSNTSTLYSSNVAQIDFTLFGLQPSLPISIFNNTANTVANVTILSITNTALTITGPAANIALGSNVSIVYYDYNNPAFLDTAISSTYLDTALGTTPEDIIIDGGAYYDTYSSHAPEELVPGATFDSLNMSVYTNVVINSQPANIGYRIVQNMNGDASSTNTALWPQYYAIFAANTTTLTANLNLTDSNIHVANASVFMTPQTGTYPPQPGVVYINGEKITFWTVDTVNNVLGQIRRGVDGTGVATVYTAGTSVVEADSSQLIPTSANANVHTTSWLNSFTNSNIGILIDSIGDFITDQNTSNIVILPSTEIEFIALTSNVNFAVGNIITQPSTGASGVIAANVVMVQANSGPLVGNTVAVWAANVTGSFTTTATTANAYVYNNGANVSSQATQISYTIVDGTGLENSTTIQARFIKGMG